MAPYIPEPRDTKDAPICRAIESQDWKTALKLVEKRLTKDNSPWLQVRRYFPSMSGFPKWVTWLSDPVSTLSMRPTSLSGLLQSYYII